MAIRLYWLRKLCWHGAERFSSNDGSIVPPFQPPVIPATKGALSMALTKTATRSAAPALVSMSPDVFTFGLIDDVDVEFTDAAAATAAQAENYNSDDVEAPLFIVEMTDINGSAHAQYYSLGKSDDRAPSAGGEGFVAVSGNTCINATTNLGMFLKSLVENGFPTETLATGNLKSIIGTKCHVMMKQTDRKSLVRAGKDASKPTGVLLVSKIHSLPGADVKGTAKVAGKAVASAKTVGGKANGQAATAATSATDEIDAVLVEKLMEALAENDPLPKKSLLQIANGAFKGTPQHSKAIARSNNAEFLKSLGESGIAFDGAQFSLP